MRTTTVVSRDDKSGLLIRSEFVEDVLVEDPDSMSEDELKELMESASVFSQRDGGIHVYDPIKLI